jgi:hypothetical protein
MGGFEYVGTVLFFYAGIVAVVGLTAGVLLSWAF